MTAVEIGEAITLLAEQPFDSKMFPFAFLEDFGNKTTTIKRLKSGSSNISDIEGAVLQRNNIHILVCVAGEVASTLKQLRASVATRKAKAKFVLATDGINLEAEDHEAIRQYAIAALNLTQQAKEIANEGGDSEQGSSTAFVDGVRRFAMSVTDLDIDPIDRINHFSEAYAILAKLMNEESLKQVAAVISAKKVTLAEEEARELAMRAVRFKKERGRLPKLTSADPYEKYRIKTDEY